MRYLSVTAVCFMFLFGQGLPLAHEAENHLQNNAFNSTAVSVLEGNDYLEIRSNAIPNHATGTFPNRNNPNAIAPQSLSVRIPLTPQWSEGSTEVQVPGIALNGVLFEPGTAECFGQPRDGSLAQHGRQNHRQRGTHLKKPPPRARPMDGAPHACDWREEAIVNGSPRLGLDNNNTHVQPNGVYHYHGISTGLVSMLHADANGLIHVGYAADGHRMLIDPQGRYRSAWQLKSGERPSGPGGRYDGSYTADFVFVAGAGALDECNGVHVASEYVYILTEQFPKKQHIKSTGETNNDPETKKPRLGCSRCTDWSVGRTVTTDHSKRHCTLTAGAIAGVLTRV